MASSNELLDFVREALARGASRPQVEDALRHAGWGRDMVEGAMTAYADVPFVVPVPKPRSYLSAREAFLYLLLFTTLYIAAFNAGVLAFLMIDHLFPDPAARNYEVITRPAARWAISSLMVSVPMFLVLSTIVERGIREDPVKRHSSVRRWLMYLTVFVAASISIGNVTTLIYSALGGELTTRFVSKVLALGAIAGTIFGYYLADLRQDDTTPVVERRSRRLAVTFVLLAMVALTASGFVVIGSPSNERARNLDARRIEDLRRISSFSNAYYQRYGRLPTSIDELSRHGGFALHLDDVNVGRYEYRVTGTETFELCATFQRDSSEQQPPYQQNVWAHGAGRQCFQRNRHDPY